MGAWHSVWLGFDPREAAAFAVAKHSAARHMTVQVPVRGIVLDEMRDAGLYTRPTRMTGGLLWDDISAAPMSTEFAISRFLTPHLAGYQGWALFMDSDVLIRGNLCRLFDQADSSKAVQVVKHDFRPTERFKMDGQRQSAYPRKNWSSVMLFNCAHPKHRALARLVNTAAGRDLHRFSWLDDDDIGQIGLQWNWLAGHSDPIEDPHVVHFTSGGPWLSDHTVEPYADEWRAELSRWASR